MTPDEKLLDAVISDALDIFRLSARKRAETLRRLKKLEIELVAKLSAETLKRSERRKVADFLKKSAAIIRDNFQQIQAQLEFGEISKTVSEITSNTLKAVLGPEALNLPLTDYFKSVASNVMIQGSPLKDWWQRQADGVATQFAAQIRQGLAGAETNQKLVSRIVGNQGVGGLMSQARYQTLALVNTSVQAVANDARRATFEKNADVISAIKQVSTLDSHTSQVCIAYSGAQWDLVTKKPLAVKGKLSPAYNGGTPRHVNCRSVEVPVTKTFKELGLNIGEKRSGTRASDEGQIAAKTTFDSFLSRKGEAYQNDKLGVGKAELWRAGKITLRDLVAGDGRPLTLKELRALAGLD